MTGTWLLAIDLKQISDCIGGRKGDAVRYCQSEQKKIFMASLWQRIIMFLLVTVGTI